MSIYKEDVFIGVEISDDAANDPELAAKLAEVCPVDIYADDDGKVGIVEKNLDECVLCELCTEAAPAGALRVKKLYDGTQLES
jgi:NAD-dependent dihydropyrimidine dehydrogenase PreA subunit